MGEAVDMSDDRILIGGREKRPIVLEDWDQHWVERFEQERDRIVRALGEVARRIEHVGSTSVPGLAAKPIIDIQLSVADVEDEAFYVPPMEVAGDVLRVREPGHRMFRTSDVGVQIHVCETGSDWERRHLLFRDWLRRSSEDRERYEAAKRELARREWDDVNDYADAKSTVINEMTTRAESWAAATSAVPQNVAGLNKSASDAGVEHFPPSDPYRRRSDDVPKPGSVRA